jgi:hypothetical protein
MQREASGKRESPNISTVRWRLPVVLLISVLIAYFDRLIISLALPSISSERSWTVAETGKYGMWVSGLLFATVLAPAFLAGAALLILNRFLKY